MPQQAPQLLPAEAAEDVLILVDETDRPTGAGGKLAVHREGLLHRAFSVFLFDRRGDVLLQRRAATKYHSGGLWANSCCGHPRVGEATETAAARRLGEEIGAESALAYGFQARYRTPLDHGLTENELVHVYAGRFDGGLALNPDEVSETALMGLEALVADAERRPERYAYWLRHYLRRHEEELRRLRDRIGHRSA
jgi:isopentenyl-diphosphate Delta-isomerase